jgi:hypothetical protein
MSTTSTTPTPKQEFPCPEILKVLTWDAHTNAGETLRVLVWSFWNHRTSINLWDRIGALGEILRGEVAALVVAPADAREKIVRRLLEDSGEMYRIDDNDLILHVSEQSI